VFDKEDKEEDGDEGYEIRGESVMKGRKGKLKTRKRHLW
jgi:hypothetical protein